jgi:hypothetical protein
MHPLMTRPVTHFKENSMTDVLDAPSVFRLMYEDRDLEPIWDWDVFEDKDRAFAAFLRVVTNPEPELGSVYITDEDGNVLIGHYFIEIE